jgi:hypothetical protein
MKNSDMPAMPQSFAMNNEECGTVISHLLEGEHQQVIGLTKREYFAAKAMQGFCTAAIEEDMTDATMAKFSVAAADALLKALEE